MFLEHLTQQIALLDLMITIYFINTSDYAQYSVTKFTSEGDAVIEVENLINPLSSENEQMTCLFCLLDKIC